MKYDVITIGDSVYDIFIRPHEAQTSRDKLGDLKLCFQHGEKISVDEVHYSIGGSACNVAVGMSRLGLNVGIIGAVGDDNEGDKIRNVLLEENIDLKYHKIITKVKTNFSIIIVYQKERTVLVYRGLKDYTEIKIPKPSSLKTKWLYMGPVANSFEPNYKHIISAISEKNINFAINPGHRQIVDGRDALMKLLYVAKILILNKEEAVDLCKVSKFIKIKELLKKLKSYGPETIIITDGSSGAYLFHDNKYYGIKVYPTEVVDNTGAGDAFSSGFLSSYIKDNDIEKALKMGVMVSSEVITDFGAETKLPNSDKIDKLLKCAPDVYNL